MSGSPSIDDLEKQLQERKAGESARKPASKGTGSRKDGGVGAQAQADILQTELADALKVGDAARTLEKLRQLHVL
jgi:hypothetical protein